MNRDHLTAKIERLGTRISEIQSSRAGAEREGKWTAASQLSTAEDKFTIELLEAQASLAELEEQEEEELDVGALLDQVVAAARSLPSYMLDDLLERLEALRRVDDPSSWAPEA